MNKRLRLVFYILALFALSSGWWAYRLYMWIVHIPGFSQAQLMQLIIKSCLVGIAFLIVIQIIKLKKDHTRPRNMAIKTLFVLGILGITGIFMVLLSIMRNPVWRTVLYEYIKGGSNQSFKTLLPSIMDAEGLAFGVYFIFSAITGFMRRLGRKELFILVGVWFCVILAEELVVQSFVRGRTIEMYDVFCNSIAVILGLIITAKWLWNNQIDQRRFPG